MKQKKDPLLIWPLVIEAVRVLLDFISTTPEAKHRRMLRRERKREMRILRKRWRKNELTLEQYQVAKEKLQTQQPDQ